ncbi:NUMOD4 domain-containing protein [Sphingobacterium sp. UBA2074]|uniref:NUMOD4 domain-containing protein n=1 Tax=Sphingobacterium sp. UBA2074 TaxID=1947487 RepID=UPI002580D8A2|nr:NUMOD4 domain-containing protein [Sphingobacterium sp. UBA2074]
MNNEIWRDIPGYEGIYQSSTKGFIRSLDRLLKNSKGQFIKKGSIKSLNKSKNGYLSVDLYRDNKRQTLLIHRIIAITFINNTKNADTVNHINGDKYDNDVNNLEWCTYSENHKHSYEKLGRIAGMKGKRNELNTNSKPIIMINSNDEIVHTFPSIMEAARVLDISSSRIVSNLKGRSKTCINHYFKYKNNG